MFMNTYEVEDALARYTDHPVLGPATRTLANLMNWTNRNSDGWAYWNKPVNAAEKLTDLIQGRGIDPRVIYCDTERTDATPEKLKTALRPIKSFRTKMDKVMQESNNHVVGRDQRCEFVICETPADVTKQREEEEDLKRRAHIALAQQISNEYGVSFTPESE